MSDTRTQRRLAAILAADVAGYSRLMGADEAGTLAMMSHVWTQVFNPAVASHRGRVVKTMGDGALVEFASAVDAVDCAVAIQAGMAAMNAASNGAAMEFRIGINLGDIVSEGDDILGDGVNVAARLETQAPRNGILVSDAVHAQVRGKVAVTFADAGELALKNIASPVRAWRWGTGGAATVADDLPSIAVLPFTNMSNDPEQEYFSDGISEDIITDLSKIAGLMVVARNSSFVYKGRTVDIRAVGRDLGVTSVLEGSIRRAGNRVRITAQLIDARNGAHLWAERYDRDLTDIFAVQDEVTMQIVGALRVTLRPAERSRQGVSRTSVSAAHDLFLQGRELLFGKIKNRDSFERAVAAFRSAIELDPDYAAPYAGLGMAYCHDFQNKWADTPDALNLARHFAELGVAKSPEDPFAHYVLSVVLVWCRELDAAKAAADRSLALSPNYAQAYGALGLIENYRGRPQAAIRQIENAIRHDPANSPLYLHFLGAAQLMAGSYAEAAATFGERIRQVPNTDLSRALLAACLGHLGELEEARRIWGELMQVNPKYSFADHLARLPFQNAADAQRLVDGLAKAGLPD